ncbi:MAG: M24 family metallopeptidase [Planctomycetota bacterium]|jgi:Xaa-Pro aminopeptidase
MEKNVFKGRIREIRGRLRKKNIGFLVVTHKANVSYCTGFLGDDSWAVIAGGGVYLVTDSRYTEQAHRECIGCKIIERKESLAQATAELARGMKSVRTVYMEKTSSITAFEALQKQIKNKVKAVGGIVEASRECKGDEEVRAIRAAGQIAMKALKSALKFAKAGVSENELAGRLDFEIRKMGAIISFDTIVAFGANGSRPHHQPGSKKLKKNDTILIDFGVKYKSYCCDITRCFVKGRPSRFYSKVYQAVKASQTAAIKTVRAGVLKREVDSAAREVIGICGLPVYGHGTGHGLGMEIHEEPYVTDKSKGKLKTGQVITVEPGVYLPGKMGVRIEDDVLVTKDGCKLLTPGDFKSLKTL